MISFARGPGGSIMFFFFLITLSVLYQGNHRTEYLLLGYAHVRSNVCEDGGFKEIILHNDSPISIKVYKNFSDFYMKEYLMGL
jgi:hypothetical protein